MTDRNMQTDIQTTQGREDCGDDLAKLHSDGRRYREVTLGDSITAEEYQRQRNASPPVGTTAGADMVNHPPHYTAGGIECIDALEAATVGLTGIEAVCTANAIKYLWRWKFKGGKQDLDKAVWYIQHIAKKQ